MLTGEIRNKIDGIWDAFWSGGISNPLSVVEQVTYLLFIKKLDEIHTTELKKAHRLGTEIAAPVFGSDQEHLRWSKFRDFDPQTMYKNMMENVFPFMKNMHNDKDSAYYKYMKDATFMMPTPKLLDTVVQKLDQIPMDNRDTKGDLYEYLLSKLSTAGKNGQFRTPRHIIDMMVALMQPNPEDIISDPACGSAGFLISANEYLREKHPEIFTDSKLTKHFNNGMFFGNDFDATMLRIGAMNMMLHGIENPNIAGNDSLSESYREKEFFTLILANPPFKGSLDQDVVAADLLRMANTKKTELLFINLFIRLLKVGGRAATIVPDGVLFGSSKAHKAVRQNIIDNHRLEAIISMPSGVFKPYAGVSTAIMIFTKTGTGGTDKVWFYDMQEDGFTLDDKRTERDHTKHEEDNIPDIINRFKNLQNEGKRKRVDQSFFVPVEEIKENNYDLSINRYKEIVHEEIKYDPPKDIINDIKDIEGNIQKGLDELERMLG